MTGNSQVGADKAWVEAVANYQVKGWTVVSTKENSPFTTGFREYLSHSSSQHFCSRFTLWLSAF